MERSICTQKDCHNRHKGMTRKVLLQNKLLLWDMLQRVDLRHCILEVCMSRSIRNQPIPIAGFLHFLPLCSHSHRSTVLQAVAGLDRHFPEAE